MAITYSLSKTSFISSVRDSATLRASVDGGDTASTVLANVRSLLGLADGEAPNAVVVTGSGSKLRVKISKDAAIADGEYSFGGSTFVVDTTPPALLDIELDRGDVSDVLFNRGDTPDRSVF